MAVENKYGEWIKFGWEQVKSNLVAWALTTFVMGLANICFIITPQVIANYMKMVRECKNTGAKPEIGKLFVFDNLVQYLIAGLIVGFAGICFPIAILLYWTLPLMAFKNMGAIDACKASFAYVKGNFFGTLILGLVIGLVAQLGVLACFLGIYITIPIALFVMVQAYEAHEAAIDAAQTA